jgi:pSer/pThr/pTyr-binding forkhead associated (FHA) protein
MGAGQLTTTPSELKRRIEAERRRRPFLEYRDGAGDQVLRELPNEGMLSVGRDDEADISLAFDKQVSRLHAELQRMGREWVIADDGLSRNGTFVGGERVVGKRRLHDGDAIRAGSTVLVYRDPARSETAGTATAGESKGPAAITDMQRQVLVALCRPFREGGEFTTPATNRTIADEVHLSVQAVKRHLRDLCDRFEIGHVPQNQKRIKLAERAIRTGTVSPRELER